MGQYEGLLHDRHFDAARHLQDLGLEGLRDLFYELVCKLAFLHRARKLLLDQPALVCAGILSE